MVALAGPDLEVLEGSTVLLSGAASRALSVDPELAWSQLEGPAVLLTNASAALTAFVAPFAPATLVFELRARAGSAVAYDRVRVIVRNAGPLAPPVFLELPADARAEPLGRIAVIAAVTGASESDVVLSARGSCLGESDSRVQRTTITLTLPAELPCLLVVEGRTANGTNAAGAAQVYWPDGTVSPAPTRVSLPARAEPGAGVNLTLAGDVLPSTTRVWAADGQPAVLPFAAVESELALSLPRAHGGYVLAAERRLGLVSGGVRYAGVEMTTGTGNLAPRASGGPDRVVQPGARFRIDTSRSFDADGDALTPVITQVLGAAAAADTSAPGTFVAPSSGELLFHVAVDDGTARSPPDTVRVTVTREAVNQAPRLALSPTRHVAPGQTFVIDATAAEDPDSGVIAGFIIAQASDDAVILLPEPAYVPTATLVAGPAGDVYRFTVSAFDAEGLGTTVSQEIIVETAGPYVDPTRGTLAGNGTAAAPFPHVEAALPTASRHQFQALLLAEGTHAALPTLPRGLGLRGGHRFEADGYVEGGAASVIPIPAETTLDGTLASDLTLRTDGAPLRLSGAASLLRVQLDAEVGHVGPLARFSARSSVILREVTVRPGASAEGALVIEPGATVSIVDSELAPATLNGVAIDCNGGAIVLLRSSVTGAAAGALAVALRARNACSADVVSSRIVGGGGATSIGIDATDVLLTLDAESRVVGASALATSVARARALQVAGRARSTLVRGTLRATDGVAVADAVGLAATNARVSLAGAHVAADGAAVSMTGGTLETSGARLEAGALGVLAVGADALALEETEVEAQIGLDILGGQGTELVGVEVTATERALRARSSPVSLRRSTLRATGSAAAVAIDGEGLEVVESTVEAVAPSAIGISSTAGNLTVERSIVTARSDSGTALALSRPAQAGTTLVSSSFLRAVTVAGPGASTAMTAAGPVVLRHATLRAGGTALELQSTGSLDAANSVLQAAAAVRVATDTAVAQPWQRAVALAIDGIDALVAGPSTALVGRGSLAGAGCSSCLTLDTSALIDDTGRLAAGDNPLVDAADPLYVVSLDIDGGARPQGFGPDIGCDERDASPSPRRVD